jgi:hypothetical protein
MTMIRLFFVFIFSSSFLFAQDKKNQIYLNADDVIPVLFSSQSSAYNLGYRRLLIDEKTLRFGFKYFYEDDNEFTFGVKPGIDFMFNNSKKWKFFYGLDTSFEYSNNFQSERKYYKIALVPFFRVEYVVSQFFSISTEPGLFFQILKIKDVDGSPIDNSNSSFSSGISSLGILNLNFSF